MRNGRKTYHINESIHRTSTGRRRERARFQRRRLGALIREQLYSCLTPTPPGAIVCRSARIRRAFSSRACCVFSPTSLPLCVVSASPYVFFLIEHN
ncbi:hypothetical protein OH77DRAFT_673514 [Trametes cingulata]|nr:hypothetical protein OH77DRAFT_673514 [Trametes cingulata]